MTFKLILTAAAVALSVASVAVSASAEPGTGSGPVGQNCVDDIAKYCADETHGNRGVRTCLETNRDKVSQACRNALDTTGPGRGRGQGMGQPQ